MNVSPELVQELLNVVTEQRNELASQNALLMAECRLLREQAAARDNQKAVSE